MIEVLGIIVAVVGVAEVAGLVITWVLLKYFASKD